MTTSTPDPIPFSSTGTAAATDLDRHHRLDVAVPASGRDPTLVQAVTVRQLAVRLQVSVQTIYDLRSQGRGPRGFRVGRELRFREGEVAAWLARLEELDADRHPAREAR